MNPKWKKLLGRIAMIMTAGLIAVTPALAVEYIDIETPLGAEYMSPGYERWQEFIPAATNISAVSVDHFRNSGTTSVQIHDALCGTIIAHGSGSGGPGWVKCDLVGVQALAPGQVYVFRVWSSTDLGVSSGNPYPDGAVWASCTFSYVDFDLAFRTWTDEEAVPNTVSTWGSVKVLYR